MAATLAKSIMPRLCFVGPMVGRNPGRVTTQGQQLTDMFSLANYPVLSVSEKENRYRRFTDITKTLIAHRRGIDIMLLEVYGGASFVVEDVASFMAKKFGHRIIMVLHGGAMPEFMACFPKWARRVLSRADALVVPSEFNARALAQHGFKAQIIPNVIDITKYEYRRRHRVSPRLFWMRTFHEIWNPKMAIRVLARLRGEFPDATLVMAGQEKGLGPEVRRLAEEFKVQDAVRFAGFLNPEQKIKEGHAADIFITTNRVDNMPVAVVEACAMGLPVVATAVGGIPDLLTHGETGLLVPNNDDAAMARAIRQLLLTPELAGRLSQNGKKLADKSSWATVRLQWEQLFHKVVIR